MKTSDQLCYAKNKFGKPLAERKADVFEMDVDANDGGRFCFLDITVAFPASVHQSSKNCLLKHLIVSTGEYAIPLLN